MRNRRLSRAGFTVAMLLGMAFSAMTPANALASADAGINEIRTLHLIRLNCDDEAEHGSDEVSIYLNGNWAGTRTNLDGGDWWPFPWSPGPAELPWTVTFKEDNGWVIGETVITVDDTGLGEIVKTYEGFHGTHFKYRFTYRVD
jgi:hypothetical protein